MCQRVLRLGRGSEWRRWTGRGGWRGVSIGIGVGTGAADGDDEVGLSRPRPRWWRKRREVNQVTGLGRDGEDGGATEAAAAGLDRRAPGSQRQAGIAARVQTVGAGPENKHSPIGVIYSYWDDASPGIRMPLGSIVGLRTARLERRSSKPTLGALALDLAMAGRGGGRRRGGPAYPS